MIKAVIFDLDGTLINSLEDLAVSVNDTMKTFGYREYTMEEVRGMIGYGIPRLVRDALPDGVDESIYEKAYAHFMNHYIKHAGDHTAVYPGIIELLRELRNKGYKTAIVSNKEDPAVKELAAHYFNGLVNVADGAREGFRNKPAPDMLIEAMRKLGVTKEETIYVGDSDADIGVARNTGVPGVIVDWGYRDRDFLKKEGAEYIVSSPEEIIGWLAENGK